MVLDLGLAMRWHLEGPGVEQVGNGNGTWKEIIPTSWSYSIEAVDGFFVSLRTFNLPLPDNVPKWQGRRLPILL